jgi:hypothetical protein
LALGVALALSACGSGGSGDSSFRITTTDQAAAPSLAPVVAGDVLVYFASEGFTGPAGTDLNGDGDTGDSVAIAVDLAARTESNTTVAATRTVILGTHVYLVVDEAADGRDWNGDTVADDFVLVHWSAAAGAPAFVDVLESTASTLVLAANRVYYESAGVPLGGADETFLRALDTTNPTTPAAVLAEAGGLARGSPLPVVRPLREDAGLLFCAVDETEDSTDYNGDADALDDTVLVLLDATDATGRLFNTGLALRDDDEPLDALALGPNDWLVAFLVDEAEQGGTNLNDQTLFSQPLLPENCPASDADALDQVLHFVEFADLEAGGNPVNTGLAGHLRVLALDGFVATISDEADASCNLNAGAGGTTTSADTDTSDDVARWVATTLPVTPARSPEDLHALATNVSGGSFGLAVLDERLIAIVDEAADGKNNDGKANDHELVAWLDPAAGNPTWDFTHQHPTNRSFGTGIFDSNNVSEPFAGTSWMAPEAVGGRLALTFLEEVPGTNANVGSLNTNLDCALVAKDTDKVDGLPVWADFESGPTLDFDGLGYSIDLTNAGIELAGGFAFFRVSEAADNRDYNDDGDKNDVVLFRNPLTTCGPVPMATSSLVAGQAIATDGVRGAAFLSSETQAGVDFNEDGDSNDLVVRYFRF